MGECSVANTPRERWSGGGENLAGEPSRPAGIRLQGSEGCSIVSSAGSVENIKIPVILNYIFDLEIIFIKVVGW